MERLRQASITGWHFISQQQMRENEMKTGFNTFRPRQNVRHFADDSYKGIILNENIWMPIKISLKFVPKGPINDIPVLVQVMACHLAGAKPLSETILVLVQIMAWHRSGDKPLSEPMMVRLPVHICVTGPQRVNSLLDELFKIKGTDSPLGSKL